MIDCDLLVIGAGFSGLASAGLYKSAFPQSRIVVLESHFLPGGQASFFRREGHVFDVGATTVSGAGPGGAIYEFHKRIGFKYPMERQLPGLMIHFEGQDIEWPLKRAIPIFKEDQRRRLIDLQRLAQELWKYSKESKGLLLPMLSDLRKLPSFHHLVPSLQSVKKFLDLEEGSAAKKIIDELLLISAQATSEEVPAFLGCLGLDYPSDVWRPEGGIGKYLFSLAKFEEGQGIKFRYKTRALKVEPFGDHVIVTADKGEVYRGSQMVMTLPIWNAYRLFKDDSQNQKVLKKYSDRYKEGSWSSFTFYGTLRTDKKLSTYWQVHFKDMFSQIASKSLFFTFKHEREDLWSFTSSTHVRANSFKALDYSRLKQELEEWFLRRVKEVEGFAARDVRVLEIGTPRTFERYTGHLGGRVGGIPHTFSNYVKGLPVLPFSGTSPIYYIGDSYFPGQGLVAIVTRALKWSNWLK